MYVCIFFMYLYSPFFIQHYVVVFVNELDSERAASIFCLYWQSTMVFKMLVWVQHVQLPSAICRCWASLVCFSSAWPLVKWSLGMFSWTCLGQRWGGGVYCLNENPDWTSDYSSRGKQKLAFRAPFVWDWASCSLQLSCPQFAPHRICDTFLDVTWRVVICLSGMVVHFISQSTTFLPSENRMLKVEISSRSDFRANQWGSDRRA